MTKVVIIGGSFGGCYTLKQLRELSKDLDIVIISPSDQIWFNVAAPRLLVEPHKIKDSFFSLDNYARKYNASFIHGEVVSTSFETNSVTVRNGSDESSIEYDFLVVASGTRNGDMFKVNKDSKNAASSLETAVEKIKKASTIAIIGGGPTGVETAGELAHDLSDKKITIYTGGKEPLERVKISGATGKLERLKVEVVNGIRSKEINEIGNAYKVSFDDGTSKTFDYVIDTTLAEPFSGYLPRAILDNNGYVKTDAHLVVDGTSNVLAIGDIVAGGTRCIVDLKMGQLPVLAATAKRVILHSLTSSKEWKPVDNTLLVPVSRDGGVGKIFGWCVPSFLVWFLKAKSFMLEEAKKDFA